jgi:hypothetical protein
MTNEWRKSYKKGENNFRHLFNNRSVGSIDSGSKSDDDSADTAVDGRESVFYLGNHTATDSTVCLVSCEVVMGD